MSPRSAQQAVLKGYKIFSFSGFHSCSAPVKTGRIDNFSAVFFFEKERSHFMVKTSNQTFL